MCSHVATARVERAAPDSKDTATFLRRARAASLKAIRSKFGALAEEEYDKIAPVIACTLPALTDSIPERKRKELAGEVTSELQVVGNAASIAIRTWVRSNDKSKARAEEREKNIGWIGRMFTAWRVSHAERREEREAAGEDDDEEDDTPVVIPSSAVTTYPKGTPVPTPSIKVQVIEERVDLSNNMTGWQDVVDHEIAGVGTLLGLSFATCSTTLNSVQPRRCSQRARTAVLRVQLRWTFVKHACGKL